MTMIRNAKKYTARAVLVCGLAVFCLGADECGRLPTWDTDHATDVTDTTAVLHMTGQPQDCAGAQCTWFWEYANTRDPFSALGRSPGFAYPATTSESAETSWQATGLASGTQYYFRLCLSANGGATACGSILSFRTTNVWASALRKIDAIDQIGDHYVKQLRQCDSELIFIFARLKKGGTAAQIAEANDLITAGGGLHVRYPDSWRAGKNSSLSFDTNCHFGQQLIPRIYYDPQASHNLSTAARESLLDSMYFALHQYQSEDSSVSDLWGYGGENHATANDTAFFHAQVLKNLPAGDPRRTLPDGRTAAGIYNAYVTKYNQYFRVRAAEGIFQEIASTQYNNITLTHIYSLRDYIEDATVKRLANEFLDLVFADMAQDFLPATGVRGGAKTRIYKGSFQFPVSEMTSATYFYVWHAIAPNYQTTGRGAFAVTAASSTYLPPAQVTAAATDADARMYVSRKPGRSSVEQGNPTTAIFPGAVRRESYRTKNHVLGTFAIDPNQHHLFTNEQNRFMGAHFASGARDMLFVTGIGRCYTAPDVNAQAADSDFNSATLRGPYPTVGDLGCRIGYAEIQGITGQDAMIIVRDPNSDAPSNRIGLSGNVWNSFVSELALHPPTASAPWYFAKAGESFIAFRIADGATTATQLQQQYVVDQHSSPFSNDGLTSNGSGAYLTLSHGWAPVVVQTSSAGEWSGATVDAKFAAFRAAQSTRVVTLNGSCATYTSRANETLEACSNVKSIPKRNGTAVSVNPPTYQSAGYLELGTQANTYLVKYPGMADRLLDFN